MKIEIRKNKSRNPFKNYYYVLVGANDEDMNVSQAYFSKWNCKRAANKLAASIPGVIVTDTTTKPYTKHGGFA